MHDTGKHSVVIPASLPAGEYLLRSEIVSTLPWDVCIHKYRSWSRRSRSTLPRATPVPNSYVFVR